ncbi:GAF domain-containing protein [candidate division KSB3 bacterium]|uniref:GAF domain-containing protein n=1 Tax=candidate division KSB3 bacterium TaxID=2044937 RepID=A0A9D5Q6X7_9BACT|nr:GAF domain-containing protein [candidate division KSB3 bacterium]MBD3326265.1 GAF domain-containing protein [candidate division KSB3 bacterium]
MPNDQRKFQRLLQMNNEIEQVKDVDVLLEKILNVARELVSADGGSIYVVKDGEYLQFSHAQNETLRKKLAPGKKLIYNTFTLPINNKSIAGYVAGTGETLNISDVHKIPVEQVPYRFDPSFDEKAQYHTQSMLTIPLKNNQNKVIGVMQLINAQDESGQVIPFSEDDIPLIRIFANNAAMALERAQMTRTLLLRMISMAELRDPEETGMHVNRVGAYSSEIYEAWARQKGIAPEHIENYKDILRMAAMLHDVGKVGIRDEILQKPGRLNDEEYEIMKRHVIMGAQLFLNAQSEFDEIAGQIALNHHERWDGTGYPGHIDPGRDGTPIPGYEDERGNARGKKGEEIPVFGRIVAVADVYDALSSRRAYKDAWDEEDVLNELKKGAGKHFDPAIIEAFLSCLEMIRAIAKRYSEHNGNGDRAVV